MEMILQDTGAAAPLSRLAIHTVTNRAWSLETCVERYAAAGVGGITLWRHDFASLSPAAAGTLIRDAGLACAGLARGGFFPAATPAARREAVVETLRAVDEAAAAGAPVLVLVCGALPEAPLEISRGWITEGIAACLSHARDAGVRLAIEPLHPQYAADRSAVISLAQANDICDTLGSPAGLGVALDVYHTWWDPDLHVETARAGRAGRLFSFHICDWRVPTEHPLNDRALMGEGCIDIRGMTAMAENSGFSGFREVEIFSVRHWAEDQDEYLRRIIAAYQTHCLPPRGV